MKRDKRIVSERKAHRVVQKFGMGPFPDGAPGCGGALGVRCTSLDTAKIHHSPSNATKPERAGMHLDLPLG